MARAGTGRPERGPPRGPSPGKDGDDANVAALADRLHAAAIRLLRRLRQTDSAMGLSAPQASALSVLAFGGPTTLNRLAEAEQVRPATMSRLVAELEREGLASKATDARDRRVVNIAVTALGRHLLETGRARRLAVLKAQLAQMNARERKTLADAVALIEGMNRTGTSRAKPSPAHKPGARPAKWAAAHGKARV